MKHMSLLLIGVFVLLGCSSNKKQEPISKSGVPVINLSEDVSTVPSLLLSEAAEKLEIVPLEMTDESVLSDITEMQVTDHNIWIDHGREFYIYRFSRTGKFLNRIGSIGQGPGEYVNYLTFLVDEDKKEVYIFSTNNGVLVYDFEGGFKKQISDFQTMVGMFSSIYKQYILNDHKFFAIQNFGLYRSVDKDSLWSFVSLDDNFQKKRLFKNPVHVGKEEQIIANRANMDRMVNYWMEYLTSVDIYNGQLTIKYPDTDTIYCYDDATNQLLPQYAIFTDEEKGDYEATHLWFKDRKAFDYFSIFSYYPTKDFVYLIGSKGEEVYTYCYNKKDGSVRLQKRQSTITERNVPWFSFPLRQMKRDFVLDNDLGGGDFTVDSRSSGKYWIDILEPGGDENWIDIDQIKSSTVIDESKKKELIRVLESATEDSNPILMIATLK
ncbi:6-bladed beta-propeller [Bacteroides fragilis]|uniref:6-bladed beta-propeller n=2 Tax=Bacteroides fragilis TaxID=817 RepID=UPI00227A8C3B|nr:6-bladed beta-propeller [Bacteroides fragilis]MCE8755781.1 6-bladed beta-propeller [Bacteroides fragilis]MCE8764525.1 6-bladed beta-propeller [Bacteroides fragilis]MCS2786583.1 6-bladed beta-propeller [Bacteroides fragilis]MCY6323976.1 6-bladed beta-propeller [Bacteroides fragilis]MCZ2595845.1 6-bladed beta-propeller [Bacteroides fragilis]